MANTITITQSTSGSSVTQSGVLSWVTQVLPSSALLAGNNLSEIASPAAARTALGLGSMAVAQTGDYQPAPTVGTADATTYLRGDGHWATPPSGGGSVTAVDNGDGSITLSGTVTDNGDGSIAIGA